MEEICNPVSAVWEEQEAEETSRSRAIASAALLRVPALPCTQCHRNIPVYPMRLPGTWQGNQLEQLETPSSSHWQNFSIANNCYLNLHHWCFNVKCPETRRDFANLPSSTGVEYGSERSVIFVLATADPNIMQANTLNERWGQYILWLCLGSDISVLGAKFFTEAKALIYLFIHLHMFISKYSFFVSCLWYSFQTWKVTVAHLSCICLQITLCSEICFHSIQNVQLQMEM